MLKRLLPIAAVALAACAPLPPLPPLPGMQPAARSVALGPAGGYQQPNVTVQVAADACNADAFIEGYKGDYYLTWNQFVGPKEGIYQQLARQQPSDARVAWNLALYKGKRFNLNGYDNKTSVYGMQNLTSQDYAIRCAATSYQKGKNAGTAAAMSGVTPPVPAAFTVSGVADRPTASASPERIASRSASIMPIVRQLTHAVLPMVGVPAPASLAHILSARFPPR